MGKRGRKALVTVSIDDVLLHIQKWEKSKTWSYAKLKLNDLTEKMGFREPDRYDRRGAKNGNSSDKEMVAKFDAAKRQIKKHLLDLEKRGEIKLRTERGRGGGIIIEPYGAEQREKEAKQKELKDRNTAMLKQAGLTDSFSTGKRCIIGADDYEKFLPWLIMMAAAGKRNSEKG